MSARSGIAARTARRRGDGLGNASLALTERVDWESFQGYAEAVLQLIGGRVVERVDSPVERVWTVTVGGDSSGWPTMKSECRSIRKAARGCS